MEQDDGRRPVNRDRAQIYCEQNDRRCCEGAGIRYGKGWSVDLEAQSMVELE